MRWLRGLWWTLALATLMVVTVGVVTSTLTHAGTGSLLPAAAGRNVATGKADGAPTLPGWGWEWQPAPDPGPMASPSHLR